MSDFSNYLPPSVIAALSRRSNGYGLALAGCGMVIGVLVLNGVGLICVALEQRHATNVTVSGVSFVWVRGMEVRDVVGGFARADSGGGRCRAEPANGRRAEPASGRRAVWSLADHGAKPPRPAARDWRPGTPFDGSAQVGRHRSAAACGGRVGDGRAVAELVTAVPDLTRRQIIERLGLTCSEQAVSGLLIKSGFTRKKSRFGPPNKTGRT